MTTLNDILNSFAHYNKVAAKEEEKVFGECESYITRIVGNCVNRTLMWDEGKDRSLTFHDEDIDEIKTIIGIYINDNGGIMIKCENQPDYVESYLSIFEIIKIVKFIDFYYQDNPRNIKHGTTHSELITL